MNYLSLEIHKCPFFLSVPILFLGVLLNGISNVFECAMRLGMEAINYSKLPFLSLSFSSLSPELIRTEGGPLTMPECLKKDSALFTVLVFTLCIWKKNFPSSSFSCVGLSCARLQEFFQFLSVWQEKFLSEATFVAFSGKSFSCWPISTNFSRLFDKPSIMLSACDEMSVSPDFDPTYGLWGTKLFESFFTPDAENYRLLLSPDEF